MSPFELLVWAGCSAVSMLVVGWAGACVYQMFRDVNHG